MLCTSGTAVANLHPALLEAAHAGVRLVAVTADRPVRLRGTGANQTTDQAGIFGPLVTYVDLGPGDASVARTALGLGDGPLHLNVQLDDPLVPTEPWDLTSLVEEGAPAPVTRPRTRPADLSPGLVTVAGATSSTTEASLVEEGAPAPVTRPRTRPADLSPGLVTVAGATSSTTEAPLVEEGAPAPVRPVR